MPSRREFIVGSLLLACSRAPSSRRVTQMFRGVPTTDGAGVRLTRVIGQPALRNLDPFIMLDRFHSDDPTAYIRGFPDHPHRGFETVTVMLDGQMRHKDNKGNSGLLGPGGVQWMTAGRGIVHSEMPEQVAGLMSGYQLWLNLPAREKMRTTEYRDLTPTAQTFGASSLHVISGRAADVRGPMDPRSTEPIIFRSVLGDERPLEIPLPMDHTAFVFVHEGALQIEGTQVPTNTIAVLSPGTRAQLRAGGMRTGFLFAAAAPIREPIVQRGPFVMNTEAEIAKAYDDYRNGLL